MLLGVRSSSFQVRLRQHRLTDACSGPPFFKEDFALLLTQNHLYVDVSVQSDSGYTMFVQD